MNKDKDRSKEKDKKVICFPGVDEYDEMSISELTKVKNKVEKLSDFLGRLLRAKIQK